MDMAPVTSSDGTLRRRTVLAAAASTALLALHIPASATTLFAEVWKDPNCGCCKDWVAHLEAGGFKVKVNDTGNDRIRERLGVDRKYGACHTALIGGYAIEGHVPVREIRRLLKERPAALGLAVPGMPVGSPGMDGGLYGNRKDPYNVMLLTKDGGATIYQRYEGSKA
jgi:hypothetical protein